MVYRALLGTSVRLEIQDSLETLEHLGPRDSRVRVDRPAVLDHSEPLVIRGRLVHRDRRAVLVYLDKLVSMESMEYRVMSRALLTQLSLIHI